MSLTVSVLIPTYNRAVYLPETLDSILSQTVPPAEVIVVDDGSTDDTEAALSPYRSRIVYRRTDNGGVCRARNIAASLATSPLLAFCDSDDLWRSDKLARQIELHRAHPELACSFTNFAIVSDGVWSQQTKFDSAPAAFFTEQGGLTNDIFPGSLYEKILVFQPIFPSTMIVTRSLFDRIGGYREELGRTLSEDLEFILRCVREGPTGVIREPVAGIRKHDGNFSANTYRTVRGELEILAYILQHHGLDETQSVLVREQINLRRIEASYTAFQQAEFHEVRHLLDRVPARFLDRKTKLKKIIAQLPAPLAQAAHKLLVR